MAFIGEDRLLVDEDLDMEGITRKLVLFDMSGMGESIGTVGEVRFVCDPRYHSTRVGVMAEGAGYSDFSQVIGQGVPFYPDPSRRVLALIFSCPESIHYKVLGVCVVHSETILRLAGEAGEGVIEWDAWRKYTIAPDTDDVPGVVGSPKYSVSGSRFVRVYTNEAEKWAKVKSYDLSHWSRQQPDLGPDGCGGVDKMRFRLIEGFIALPQSVWKVCDAVVLQDSLVLFSVSSPPLFLRFDNG